MLYFSILFPNETTPIGLSLSMFPTTLQNLGTPEQAAKWVPKTRNFEIVGTYAQTELGHGESDRYTYIFIHSFMLARFEATIIRSVGWLLS